MNTDEVAAIREQLAGAEERLADLAMDLLSEAMGDADPKASAPAKAERLLTRARRSVTKAQDLLRSLEGDFDGES